MLNKLKFSSIAVFCVLTMTRCAAIRPSVDTAFDPYIQAFEMSTGRSNTASVSFGNTGFPWAVGYCRLGYAGRKDVIIGKAFWDRATLNQRKRLVFHELGHCVLGLGHSDDKKDLMYPEVQDEAI